MAKLPNRGQRIASKGKQKRPKGEQTTEARDQQESLEQIKRRAARESAAGELRPIKRRRRKRLRLGEAFRKAGLDEQTVAETYVIVVERLRGKIRENTVQKLLVDVLKECSRVLDPPRNANAGTTDQPTIVELHHSIPRPAPDEFPEQEESSGL